MKKTGHFFQSTMQLKQKDFNVLIDGKKIFDVPVKKKEVAYEKIMSFSKSDDYTTGSLLDYE